MTETEKREYGEKLGQLLAELKSLKDSKKSLVKDFGIQIEAIEHRVHDLGEALRHGYEWRDAETLPFDKASAV